MYRILDETVAIRHTAIPVTIDVFRIAYENPGRVVVYMKSFEMLLAQAGTSSRSGRFSAGFTGSRWATGLYSARNSSSLFRRNWRTAS